MLLLFITTGISSFDHIYNIQGGFKAIKRRIGHAYEIAGICSAAWWWQQRGGGSGVGGRGRGVPGEFLNELGPFRGGSGHSFNLQKAAEIIQIEVSEEEQIGLDEGASRIGGSEQHFQMQFVPFCSL